MSPDIMLGNHELIRERTERLIVQRLAEEIFVRNCTDLPT